MGTVIRGEKMKRQKTRLVVGIKTGYGDKTTKKQLDKSVDVLVNLVSKMKLKDWKAKNCRAYRDGTTLIFEK